MPSNVPAANPTTVLPAHLAREFEREQYWPVDENEYADGDRQSKAQTTTPTIRWRITPNMDAAKQVEMWNFLKARRFIETFYFYDGTETSPPWSHDPTGVNPVGRYVVIAKSPLGISRGMARGIINLVLEQRA